MKGLTELFLSRKQIQEYEYLNKQIEDKERQISNLEQEVWLLSIIYDSLTKIVYGRRVFSIFFENELERGYKKSSLLTVALFDIDGMKTANANCGYNEGDRAIEKIANTIKSNLTIDRAIAARVGGDEFAVIFPDIDGSSVYEECNRIQLEIESLKIPNGAFASEEVHESVVERFKGKRFITASVAIFSKIPNETDTYEIFMDEAERIMYSAKVEGYNSIKIFTIK